MRSQPGASMYASAGCFVFTTASHSLTLTNVAALPLRDALVRGMRHAKEKRPPEV